MTENPQPGPTPLPSPIQRLRTPQAVRYALASGLAPDRRTQVVAPSAINTGSPVRAALMQMIFDRHTEPVERDWARHFTSGQPGTMTDTTDE